jgi:hypothetical protein
MKHFALTFGLAALSAISFANPVNLQTAQSVATNFIGRKLGSNATLILKKTYTAITANAQTSFYIFDVNNGSGFVIVSGDDAVTPVLGYSTTNTFPAAIDNKEVSYWMDGYNEQISKAITNQLTATPKIAADWSLWSATAATGGNTGAKPTDVAPLITTEWDQMNPSWGGSLYNNLCPSGTPTGCVATAMAQIMNFWKAPTMGTGSHSYSSSTVGGSLTANFGATTYNWTNMPNHLTSSSTPTQKNAIATLMFHCGVSVDMNYDYSASGAQVINFGMPNYASSQTALLNYFNYKSTIQGNRRMYYSDTQWVKMLKFEIDNGRPVLYAGFGTVGGHAFDFDGYDNNNLFHINWGWSGMSDGYFTVDNLAPSALGTGGGGGNFNDGQQALIMIEPAGSTLPANPNDPDYPLSYSNLNLNTIINQSNDTIIYQTGYTVTADIKNAGTENFAQGGLSLVAVNVADESIVIPLNTRNNISLNQGATYSYSYTTASNSNLIIGMYRIRYRYATATGAVTGGLIWRPVSNGIGTNDVILNVVSGKPTGISDITLDAGNFNVYPNPSADVVSVDWKGFSGVVTAVELFNVVGQKVAAEHSIHGTNTKVSVSQLSAGTYSLRIVTDKGSITKNIAVKK